MTRSKKLLLAIDAVVIIAALVMLVMSIMYSKDNLIMIGCALVALSQGVTMLAIAKDKKTKTIE